MFSSVQSLSHVQLFVTLGTVAYQDPLDSPGKSTGAGCHFLVQGIFPTQGLNLGLPLCRQTLYPLSYKGIPKYSLMKVKVKSLSGV